MSVVLILASLSLLAYLTMIVTFRYRWRHYPSFNAEGASAVAGISVVIAFRDESSNLPRICRSLENQTYPKEYFEVIFCDDHSTDGSAAVVERYCQTNGHFRLNVASPTAAGKKAVLYKGIQTAVHEIIVTTDADCEVPGEWLSTIAAFYERHRPDLVVGLVQVAPVHKGIFGQWEEVEMASLVASGAAAAIMNKAIFCSGANLSYRKSLVDSIPDPLRQATASGDDTLFMLKVKKNPLRRILLLKSREAIVTTTGVTGIFPFIRQRFRWASKSRFYSDGDLWLTAIIAGLASLFLVLSGVISLTAPAYWFFPIFLAVKTLVDYSFVKDFMAYSGKRPLLLPFLFFELLYPFYYLFTALAGPLSAIRWKGRMISYPALRKT